MWVKTRLLGTPTGTLVSGNMDQNLQHGCRWETFYIFAYCGLVGNPYLLKFKVLLPFQRQPRQSGVLILTHHGHMGAGSQDLRAYLGDGLGFGQAEIERFFERTADPQPLGST